MAPGWGVVVLPLLPGAQEVWGLGGKGAGVGESSGTTLSASWEAAVSHVGKIDGHCKDGGPVPPTAAVAGVPAGSGPAGACGGEGTAVLWPCHHCPKRSAM